VQIPQRHQGPGQGPGVRILKVVIGNEFADRFLLVPMAPCLCPSPAPALLCPLLVLGMQMLIHGGAGDNHYYGDTWLLHLAQRRWTQVLVETDSTSPGSPPPPPSDSRTPPRPCDGGRLSSSRWVRPPKSPLALALSLWSSPHGSLTLILLQGSLSKVQLLYRG